MRWYPLNICSQQKDWKQIPTRLRQSETCQPQLMWKWYRASYQVLSTSGCSCRTHTSAHKGGCWVVLAGSQQQAFDVMKQKIMDVSVLRHCQPGQPLTTLWRIREMVTYASRALSETEQGHIQIEKMLLAVALGVEQFHHYIYCQ